MTLDQGGAGSGTGSAQALVAALADAAVVVDGDGVVTAWNLAAQERLRLSADARGRPLDDLLDGDARADRRISRAGRVALADGSGSAILVWRLDEDVLGPDELALQKGDALGRVAGGVLHDVRGKFTAILGAAALLAGDPAVPPDLRDISSQLGDESATALALVDSALVFARRWSPSSELTSVGSLVRDLMHLVGHATINMNPTASVPESLPQIEVDRALLRQALLALLINAVEAQGAQWGPGATQVPGRLVVSGRELKDDGGHRIRLTIEDGGPTVPEAARATLFTGAESPRGGRDLSVAAVLLARAGARLGYEPLPNGNRLVVELPAAGTVLPVQPPTSQAARQAPEPPDGAVLVCDADPLVRGLLVRMMERAGLLALEAGDDREAAEVLASRPVAAVIASRRMPHATGMELYERLVAGRPDLAARFILTTEDIRAADVASFAKRTGVPVVGMPFDHARLMALVLERMGG